MKLLLKIIKEKFFKTDKIENIKIESVAMNTNEVKENTLFFAINKGNDYIDLALNSGASLVIADNYKGDSKSVIRVQDTVECMQELAKEYRKRLDIKIVAITGSNGKTTTKDIIYNLLTSTYKVKKTIGNLNNHIGLPFTILSLKEEDEIAILELGMSNLGEIDLLADISRPDFGIITNIGDSHLENLKNKDNVFKAKTELLKYVGNKNIIVFGDDKYLSKLAVVKLGFSKENTFRIRDYAIREQGSEFKLNNKKYITNLVGEHNIVDLGIGLTVCYKLNLNIENVEERINNIELTPMRFQKIEKGQDIYINDAYNASPMSMKYSIETYDKLDYNYKIAVLADMLELGDDKVKFHVDIINTLKNKKIDRVFLYGDIFKQALEIMDDYDKEKIFVLENKEEIKNEISKIKNKKSILLKGSRGMKLEEIIEE